MSSGPWLPGTHPLAKWRYENKVTQKQLGAAAGVSYATVSRIERGEPVSAEKSLRILETAKKWHHTTGG